MKLAELKAVFDKQGIKTSPAGTVAEALSLARNRAGTQDLICVSGSLFVVAEAIEQLEKP